MTVIKTNLLTQLQNRINGVSAATAIEDIIALRRAARNMGLNETPLNTELSARIAGLNAASTIDAIFESAMALPNNGELGAINEVRAFCTDQDTIVDQYGGLWLRAGVISYDVEQYPQAVRIPIIEDVPSTAPMPVAQPALSNMTGKRVASSGSVVIAINSSGNGLTRWVNDFTTAGSAVSMTGVLAGTIWSAVCYDERLQQFVMVGHSSSKIVRSVDGQSWFNVSIPSGMPAWSDTMNAVVHGGKSAIHLFVQNKHWTSVNLTNWAAMPDTVTPNGDSESIVARNLKGVIETPAGQMMLWGDFMSLRFFKPLPYVAISDSGGAMNASIAGYSLMHSIDSSQYLTSCAAVSGTTDFEIWLVDWYPFTIRRTSANAFSAVSSTTVPQHAVPQHAISYRGLTVRISGSALTAQNQAQRTVLPYGSQNQSILTTYIKAIAGTVIIRLGHTIYVAGNNSAIWPFDVKQFVGLFSAASINSANPVHTIFGSYFVRIK